MRGGVNVGVGGRSWGSCSIHFAAGLLWSQLEPSALGANVVGAHMYQEDPEFWPLLVISGSVVHQIECSSVITAGSTIRGDTRKIKILLKPTYCGLFSI